MGIKGTDVAKEAAQAVLADDNYATLARGVFEGRHFFDNLRKGGQLLSCRQGGPGRDLSAAGSGWAAAAVLPDPNHPA